MIDGDRLQKQSGIIGTSDGIRQVLDMIVQVAPVDISVLITGESGTGKEVVAKAIHQSSKRNSDPLVVVNCGAIPEGIIESELFGHKKGSFTGAGEDRKGYFEEATKGTIFLDEIGEMPLSVQAEILRVIETGEVKPLGSSKTILANPRLVVASHKDLAEEVKAGRFREDLYYRLLVVPIEVPPLRRRPAGAWPRRS